MTTTTYTNFSQPLNTGLPKATVKSPMIDFTYLNEISGRNVEFIEAMLTSFRNEAGKFLNNFEAHFSSGDFKSMRMVIHKIKPAGVFVGAKSVSLLASSLELAVGKSNREEASSLFDQLKNLILGIFKEIDNYFEN